MATLFDYLDWRGDISFTQLGPNAVDSLILSELTYINYEGIVPERRDKAIPLNAAAARYLELQPAKKKLLGLIPDDELRELLLKAAGTVRFGALRLWGFVNEIEPENESQFAALCYTLPGGSTYAAFRGTDDSIVGWKENFNMAFMFPVPAQRKAAAYLNAAADQCFGPIYVGGHSKGGNLAVYASAFSEPQVRLRIKHIWSHDGPGFMPEVIEGEEYKLIKGLITQLVPTSSLVGVLLENDCETQVVESSAFGPKQHDGLSWEVMGGSFVKAGDTSSGSKQFDETAEQMVKVMSPEQRRSFIESVFSAVKSTGARTLPELKADGLKPSQIKNLFKNLELEPEAKEQFIRALLSSFNVDERIVNFLSSRARREDEESGEPEE